MFQVFRYRLDLAQPRRNYWCIFFLPSDADLRAETQVAHVIHQCLGEYKTFMFVVPVILVLFESLHEDEGLVHR